MRLPVRDRGDTLDLSTSDEDFLPPPRRSTVNAAFRIEVDFPWETSDRVKPLCGVNKGVLTYPKYGRTEERPTVLCDFTRLYHAAGVSSVRTHSDVFDVANILRGDGGFVSGIGVHPNAPAPTNQAAYQTAIANYLIENDGRFFTIGGLNEAFLLATAGVEYDQWDAWLYWYPTASVASGDFFYDDQTTGALASYVALVDGGFEIYYRAGESNQGPSYMEPAVPVLWYGGLPVTKWRYADAAAEILHHLVSSTFDPATLTVVAPRFVEIWNEPDGAGYSGSYAPPTDATPAEWAADYREMVDAMNEALGHLAPTGGFGISDHGAGDFIASMRGEGTGKVFELLKDIRLADLPFLSFHVYGMEPSDQGGGYDALMDHVMRFANKLVDLRRSVDVLSWIQHTLPQISAHQVLTLVEGMEVPDQPVAGSPPLHITEWNAWTEANADWEFPGLGLWGAFVSAALTWMQHPYLDIERAHFWDGRAAIGPSTANPLKPVFDHGIGLFSVLEDRDLNHAFVVRASALAMSLHADLAGDDWVPVEIEKTVLAIPEHMHIQYPDVLAAAQDRAEVSVLATQSPTRQRRTIVVTNLASMPREVELAVSGLFGDPAQPSERHTVTIRTFDAGSFPPGGVKIRPETGSLPVAPDPAEVEDVFDQYIDTEHSFLESSGLPPWQATDEISLSVPAFGVVRIDIEAGEGRIELPSRD